MTTSKVRSYIINKLRTVQNWTDEHKLARQRAKVGPNLFRCAKCGGAFSRNDTHIDHQIPVIDPTVGFVDWNTYMVRLFCSADNLQVLCVDDHAAKTLAENELREKHGTGRFSAASRAKLSRSLMGNKCANGPKSSAHKTAMSASRRGRPQTEARKIALERVHHAGRKPVIAVCIATGVETEYPSGADAAISLGISSGNISKIACGLAERSQCKGYMFKFKGA